MSTKTLINSNPQLIGFGLIDGQPSTPVYGTLSTQRQFLVWGDEGHYGYPNFPPDRDIGGAFNLVSNVTNFGSAQVGTIRASGPYKNYRYKGSIVTSVPGIGDASQIDGSSFAASAYSKMKPTRPSFSGLNAIIELRDVPRMLQQRLSGNNLKDIGSYYLALKFGWDQLLRDIRNTVMFQRNAEKRLKQLLRDNGKPVYRRLDDVYSSSVITYQNSGSAFGTVNSPDLVTYFYSGTPNFIDVVRSIDRVWACAQFRFWLPDGPRDIAWTRRMLAALYGLNPSPAVVWNAIPWTWLIDWFANAGDVIENLDAGVANRLAADYFYVMRESGTEWKRSVTVPFYNERLEAVSFTGSGVSRSVNKTRLKGDPFGFQTTMNSLSGSQLAILGALGLSRL